VWEERDGGAGKQDPQSLVTLNIPLPQTSEQGTGILSPKKINCLFLVLKIRYKE
jgi:hypothetical protein